MRHFYGDLDGYFDFAAVYERAVKQLVTRDANVKFVELGVFHGRSLAFMAVELWNACAKIGALGNLFGFDLFKNSIQGHPPTEVGRLITLFEEKDIFNTFIVQSDTKAAAERFPDGDVDFVFVDADHTYEGCLGDLKAWVPKVRKGGVIAGHDYFTPGTKPVSMFMGLDVPEPIDPFPGVKKAVLEMFGQERVEVMGRSFWVQL